MSQSLKSVLNSLLDNAGLTTGINQQKALQSWAEIVGSTIASNTVAEKVEHGILVIRAATPAWRQELLFKKALIIERLNKKLGTQTIRDIRFI